MATKIATDFKKLKALKAKRDKADAAYKAADKEFKEFQWRLMARAEEEGVESIRVDGTLFVPTETIYAKVQDPAKFVEYALDNDESLVEYKARKEVINQLVRELLDNGEDEKLAEIGLGYYVREYIAQRAG